MNFSNRDMRKIISYLILIIVFLTGCNFLGSGNHSKNTIYATFLMTNTAGEATKVFHSGESFDLSFSMKNTTEDTLTYSWTYPMISFEILGSDSTVSYSYDGCATPAFGGTAKWAPGKSITGSWKAPTPICMQDEGVLVPGTYLAEVNFPDVKNMKVIVSSPIKFTVIQ